MASTFWPVLSWTLIWAVVATVSCYILGLLLALLINRKGTRAKGFWRFMFVLSVAVPQFVTLLSMRTIFNANGPVNVLLREIGMIGATESIPFFTDPLYAKITIICINIWIGVPFTMLSTTGILQNIPAELYEAAKIDGASAPTIFRKITLPYMLFVMTPNLITSFTGFTGLLLRRKNGFAGYMAVQIDNYTEGLQSGSRYRYSGIHYPGNRVTDNVPSYRFL